MGVNEKGFFNPLRKPMKPVEQTASVAAPAFTPTAPVQTTVEAAKPKITAEQYLAAKNQQAFQPKVEAPQMVTPSNVTPTVKPVIQPVENKAEAIAHFENSTSGDSGFDFDVPKTIAKNTTNISKQDVIEMARSMGLEIAKPKVKWAKHSFEYREETLLQFKKMVRQLGYASIKEATEEMMTEWVNKRAQEYQRRLSK